jgi:hypothetical protein
LKCPAVLGAAGWEMFSDGLVIGLTGRLK